MCTTVSGLEGTTIRLKWHGLRRHPGDPGMLRTNLDAGLAEGAVMEADIRLTRDGRWACLHDETLELETNGRGPVGLWSASELAAVRMRAPSGALTDEPLVYLDDLVAAAARHAGVAGAEVQLDLKEASEALSDGLLDEFARQVGPLEGSFSLSGVDSAALARLRSAVPSLRVTSSCSRQLGGARDASQFQTRLMGALAETEGISMVWVHHRVLQASYRVGFDLVGFAHRRGVGVDTGTIDVGANGWRRSLVLALQAKVDRITTNSPCALAQQVRRWRETAARPELAAS
jgi:glycerophosphoryl diester phosphodiesterase